MANVGARERAEHRAVAERALRALDAARERFEGNSKPLSYSKIQYGDYVAGFALPEAQRAQFYAGLLDFYFTGVEPTHFNKGQQLVFAGIRQRALNARAQALSKSGARLPKIWDESELENPSNMGAKAQADLTCTIGAAPAVSIATGAHLGADLGARAATGQGGGTVPPTTNYELSPIAHEAIGDKPSSHELGATQARGPTTAELYHLGVPLKAGLTLAPCPQCGKPLLMYADGRGKPMAHCSEHGYQTIELPENMELIEAVRGSGSYALREKNGIEKRSNGDG